MKRDCVAIVQARRGSTRFPNKVLKKIIGKPMLYHVLKRVQSAELISKVVLATTTDSSDRILAEVAKAAGTEIFFGNADDVLDRYFQAAKKYKAANIVRITADCPVMDPSLINSVISAFNSKKCEYASNALVVPEGLGVEVFTFEALKKAWIEAKLMSEREHVTPYIWKNHHLFDVIEFKGKPDSDLRLTVDYPVDLLLIRKIYHHLFGSNPYFGYREILSLVEQHPSLSQINKGIPRRQGYLKSLIKDKAS